MDMGLGGLQEILMDREDDANASKLTFSSPVVTDEFSKFADILSAALSQHVYIYLCKNIYFEAMQ